MTGTRNDDAPTATAVEAGAGTDDASAATQPGRVEATLAPAAERTREAARATADAVGRARQVAEEQTLPVRVALFRGRTGRTVAGAAFLGFLAIFLLVKARRTAEVDAAITLRLQAEKHRSLGLLMEAVSWPGFPPQSRLIPPVMMAVMWLLRLRVEAAFQFLAWGTGGLSSVIKGFTRRERPLPEKVRVVVAPLGGSSFPSGHVLTYVGTYGFAAYVVHSFVRPAPVRRPIVGGLLLLLGLVGPSRIYQGHHWPTDVAASYLIGLTYLIGVTALHRRARRIWRGPEWRHVRARRRRR